MTELEFGARLRQLRQEKRLTQQELADRLGVSNKSVSRWESGGYPDIVLLPALAKVLGVSVDELLGCRPPLRSFGRSDWQNLMSYAFALGGGVAFYLLDLFMPMFLCYLLYLAAMAYGIYLQRHYTYHSHWFYGANALMDFFVNMRIATALMGGQQVLAAAALSMIGRAGVDLGDIAMYAIRPLCTWAALILLLTGVTQGIIWRTAGEKEVGFRWRAGREVFSRRKLPPMLGAVVLSAFWWLYSGERLLPPLAYRYQGVLYLVLWAVVSVLVLGYLAVVKRRWMMIPASGMQLCCLGFALVCEKSRAYSVLKDRLLEYTPYLNQSIYRPFGQGGAGLLVMTAAVLAVYLLCCFVRLEKKDS